MEFKISKKDLLKGLERTLSVVERRNTMPSLNHALFEIKDGSIQISATDLEIFVSSSVPCKTLSIGRMSVPARNVFDIVKECGDGEDIHVKGLDNNRVEIKSGKSQFKLLGLSADSFPHFKTSPKGQLSTSKLSCREFSKLLAKTEHSVSLDEIRYFFTGICLESITDDAGSGLRAVATDSHRLALMDVSNEKLGGDLKLKKNLIIPKKGVVELRKLLETSLEDTFEITCDENLLRVSTDDFHLWIRPIDGEFPDYRRATPLSLPHICKVNRRDLLTSLRRMNLLVSDRSKVVTFEFKKDRIVLSTVNPDLGEATDEVMADYNGTEFKTGYNVRFFIDAFSHLDADSIEIELGEKLQPALLKSKDNPGYLIVIMPMRI
jgi:DNA polymerase-3 subunit beta